MKRINKPLFSKIFILVGITLLVIGIFALIGWQWNINSSIQKSEFYVETIRSLTPQPQGAILEERKDNSMPSLSIDKTDFIGILEIPKYSSVLPVCAEWGRISKYPCNFSGSIFNGTLQIGATSQKGQYDFYREISVGDTLIFTDMEGNRYTYAVTNLRYEKHADEKALNREKSDLTLFIKNIYNFEYLIVYCNVLN